MSARSMIAPAETPITVTRFVVDASVAIKWFVPEIHAEVVRRLLREGITLLAPDLIWAEVANALWRKWREKELPAEAVEGILNDFRRYPLRICSGESPYDVAWPAVQGSGRTFYDAVQDTPWCRHVCGLKTCPPRMTHECTSSDATFEYSRQIRGRPSPNPNWPRCCRRCWIRRFGGSCEGVWIAEARRWVKNTKHEAVKGGRLEQIG